MGKKIKNIGTNRMTSSQYEAYEEELRLLKVVERKRVAKKIKAVREKGDLSNNEEYDQAKNEQRNIERRINELELIIKHAVIVEDIPIPDKICIGCSVTLFDIDFEEEIEYTLVSNDEADFQKGKISIESPVGKALLGTKPGDLIDVLVNGFSSQYQVMEITDIDSRYVYLGYTKTNRPKLKKDEDRPVNDITPKHFLTRVNTFHCTNAKHVLEDILCKVRILKRNGDIETCLIPGAYCKNCDKYYILEKEFENYKKKGVLLCKIVEEDYWLNGGRRSTYGGLNNESLLHMLGYNVNATVDLSKEQRWGILEIIVDEKILSAAEICSHLQWLIRQNKNRDSHSVARMKWQMDSDHISNYNPSKKRVVKVGEITKKNYH